VCVGVGGVLAWWLWRRCYGCNSCRVRNVFCAHSEEQLTAQSAFLGYHCSDFYFVNVWHHTNSLGSPLMSGPGPEDG
jgi:hypothetical protein